MEIQYMSDNAVDMLSPNPGSEVFVEEAIGNTLQTFFTYGNNLFLGEFQWIEKRRSEEGSLAPTIHKQLK